MEIYHDNALHKPQHQPIALQSTKQCLRERLAFVSFYIDHRHRCCTSTSLQSLLSQDVRGLMRAVFRPHLAAGGLSP
jgi:hypothetical protein